MIFRQGQKVCETPRLIKLSGYRALFFSQLSLMTKGFRTSNHLGFVAHLVWYLQVINKV